jgi:lysyl-tRNA synthetase class 2
MSQPPTAPTEKSAPIEKIIQQRREKKDNLINNGKNVYGRRFEKSHNLKDIHDHFGPRIVKQDQEGEKLSAETVQLAGRLLTRRDMGKLCFAHLHDRTGKLQIKLNQKEIGPELFKAFLKDVDLGDILGCSGKITRTKTGELTLQVEKFEILSKSLRPWPEKFHGVTDIETRSRQRELDLVVNEESRKRFLTRSHIIHSLRTTLDKLGFIEVETPLMQAVPGGAAARPFITHHTALDLDLYMRVAPELYLKRLLVGGFDRVYEIGRAFRNEGIDTRHNPEFTILEAYQAFGDVNTMMDLTETLIIQAAQAVGIQKSSYRGQETDLTQKFDRVSMVDLFKKYASLNLVDLCQKNNWKEAAISMGISVPNNSTDRKCFDLIFDEKILAHLKKPTFVLDYPTVFSPLAKAKANQPLLTDRFELFLAQEEVANAYTEQNDPDEQSKKFAQELAKRKTGDEEAMPVDEEFITALEHGMPPAGGLGIGVDRLTMVLTGTESIREVILFPLLRPQNE